MDALFWYSLLGVLYAYAGYPCVLYVLVRLSSHGSSGSSIPSQLPTLTVVTPVYNERGSIAEKLENCRRLVYPADRLEFLFVSDGSTDGTAEAIRAVGDGRIRLLEMPARGGKAAALNAALERISSQIVVFSDASIQLREDALLKIVHPFEHANIGCVSGEDHVSGNGGEGLYGRYELFLRRLESRLSSIVGASGSFYAQRRELCKPFLPNMAPDFVSVLVTVEHGYRAVAAPDAIGTMTSVVDPADEFRRKNRTMLRGITALLRHTSLLNPFRYGWFAFELLSHKLIRWLAPFFLFAMLVSSAILANGSGFFAMVLVVQLLFYGLAVGALANGWLASTRPGRIALYFVSVNVATLSAWLKYAMGGRQEIWAPSRR